jgi:hypothetical protein
MERDNPGPSSFRIREPDLLVVDLLRRSVPWYVQFRLLVHIKRRPAQFHLVVQRSPEAGLARGGTATASSSGLGLGVKVENSDEGEGKRLLRARSRRRYLRSCRPEDS